ncbi:ribosome biogenesis GTP-binding protein YihA/YsxC [Candidatus Lariskella endosymbiont of Hedychridium roseum]|uniref:ribosome biogenesis GTP-binding protein YihA/YsxC n=1 Tax=Candidatus Lariskella endosymbiont of Hedychridium roseum TaxID=3077949 RepID=UPI0030CDABAC
MLRDDGLLKGFFQYTKFIAGTTTLNGLNIPIYPEIAFVGRSNVGKSSMINLITGNKKMARVSRSPGCTRQINFFLVRNTFILVDLPGYGYASASKSMIKNWQRLMVEYCLLRAQLKQIMLLIDSKLGITKKDAEIIETLRECGTITQIVLTKCDRISQTAVKNTQEQILKSIENEAFIKPNVLLSSSKSVEGFCDMRSEILNTLSINLSK